MSNTQALLDCTFSWGKICRIYGDSIEIAGKSYRLEDLTAIHPSYHTLFGITSARLELCFGPHRLILRGIPDPATARQIVAHLSPYVEQAGPQPVAPRTRFRLTKDRHLIRSQAHAWERIKKTPTRLNTPQQRIPATPPPEAKTTTSLALPRPQSESLDLFDDFLDVPEQSSSQSSTRAAPAPVQPALETRSNQRIPEKRELGTGSLPPPAPKSSVLPVIHVPVRLQPGECAHYSIGAALYSDKLNGATSISYPPLDQGLLILTNRRVFYLGKRCQLVLAYTHLWYVSLLQNAVALHIERQFRRIILEIEHPQEWASRIEQLAFIARRALSRSAPSAPTFNLPGVKPATILPATSKRATLALSASHKQEDLVTHEMATLAEQETIKMPVLAPHISSADENTSPITLQPQHGQEDEEMPTIIFPIEEKEETPPLLFHEEADAEEEITTKRVALVPKAQIEPAQIDACALAPPDQPVEAPRDDTF